MKIIQQDRIAREEVGKHPVTKLTGQGLYTRVLDLPEVRSEWIRNPYHELANKLNMEITQQDWIAYQEVRENPITKLTGQGLFARALGLPKQKLEWIRNHYDELSREFEG
jgi:hypothetical protein